MLPMFLHMLTACHTMPFGSLWIFAGHRRDLEGLSWPVEPHWGAAHAIPALGHSPQEETPWLSEAVNEVRGNQWADEVGYFQHRPPNIFQFMHTQASCHQAESFLNIWLVQHPRSVRNEWHRGSSWVFQHSNCAFCASRLSWPSQDHRLQGPGWGTLVL